MMRRTLTTVVTVTAALAVGGVIVATAGPAWAGCNAPEDGADVRIRKAGSNSYVGNNVFNCNVPDEGNPQIIETSRRRGKSVTFEVRVRNAGSVPDDLVVHGGISGDVGSYVVKYFRGGKNITTAIETDGKTFRDLAAGASTPVIQVRVKVKNGAVAPSRGRIEVWAQPEGESPSFFDRVWADVNLPGN